VASEAAVLQYSLYDDINVFSDVVGNYASASHVKMMRSTAQVEGCPTTVVIDRERPGSNLAAHAKPFA
jgi:hypothetical protein